jgi:hypothetical protein
MRFLITAHPGPAKDEAKTDAGADAPFDEKLFTSYMKFNEELHKAGVLVASEGLAPTARGAHVVNVNGKRSFVDGPYAETKELIGGFYLIDVSSRDEAIAWALRCPTGLGFDDVLELHQLTGEADIPKDLVDLIVAAAPTWSESWSKPRR